MPADPKNRHVSAQIFKMTQVIAITGTSVNIITTPPEKWDSVYIIRSLTDFNIFFVYRAIAKSSVIITTPEKWDGVSRSWQTRDFVRDVTLIVIDEIHLLGEDRGPVSELNTFLAWVVD
jgi:hypothetical protein